MIRKLNKVDVERIKEIHEKFYKTEFSFPNFFNKFLSAFVVEDDNGEIVVAGGVRTILEAVILTNKQIPTGDRRGALYHALEASLFTAGRCEYEEIHAFVQDEQWAKHLTRVGFKPTKGNALVLTL